MTFPLWFSGAEQVLRYHAVRENLYARRPDVPAAVYARRRAYTAYLLENTLPGEPDGPPRRLPEMLSTDGDLIGVPGIELALAEAIVGAAPFASIDDLARVPGMTGETVRRFRAMQDAMRRPTSAAAEEAGLSLRAVLLPYVWRAFAVWLGCAIAGAMLYRTVRRARWWRLAVNGLAAAALVLAVGWMLEPPALAVVPLLVLLGLPAAVLRYWRSRSVRQAALVVGAWLVAALPAFVALTPL